MDLLYYISCIIIHGWRGGGAIYYKSPWKNDSTVNHVFFSFLHGAWTFFAISLWAMQRWHENIHCQRRNHTWKQAERHNAWSHGCVNEWRGKTAIYVMFYQMVLMTTKGCYNAQNWTSPFRYCCVFFCFYYVHVSWKSCTTELDQYKFNQDGGHVSPGLGTTATD